MERFKTLPVKSKRRSFGRRDDPRNDCSAIKPGWIWVPWQSGCSFGAREREAGRHLLKTAGEFPVRHGCNLELAYLFPVAVEHRSHPQLWFGREAVLLSD